MTSLPMPECAPPPAAVIPFAAGPSIGPGISRVEGEEFLLRAFRSFAEAAESLEYSYATLRSEVARLREKLEESNADLKRSLEDNVQMRQHLDRRDFRAECWWRVRREKFRC